MENEIQIFNNLEFGNVRIAQTEQGEPLFCLADVARVLDLTPSKVAQRLEDDVLSRYTIPDSLGRQQVTNFVNEDGLYDIILDSRKPEAKRFRKWITSDVLPTIRKHGAYMTDQTIEQALLNPDTVIKLATSLKEEREARLALQAKNAEQLALIAEQDAKIQDMTAKSTYCELVLASKELVEITLIAQDYGTTATIMNRFLHSVGIQFRQGDTWVLYEKYKYKGYTQSKTFPITHNNGTVSTKVMTMWTQKGRLFLYEFLKDNHGALPIVEREDGYVQPYGLMSSTAKKAYKKAK